MTHSLQAESLLPNFPSKLNPCLLKLIALQANLQRGMIASQLKATGKGANINFTRRGGVLKAEIKFESNGASYPRDLRMRRVPQFQKNIQAHEALM
jgi:hypothetical protein